MRLHTHSRLSLHEQPVLLPLQQAKPHGWLIRGTGHEESMEAGEQLAYVFDTEPGAFALGQRSTTSDGK